MVRTVGTNPWFDFKTQPPPLEIDVIALKTNGIAVKAIYKPQTESWYDSQGNKLDIKCWCPLPKGK